MIVFRCQEAHLHEMNVNTPSTLVALRDPMSGVLRNSDDDMCPTTVRPYNWQGVETLGSQADVLHLDSSSRVPLPWNELDTYILFKEERACIRA